jgi:DNA-directed RNA polymerase beta' subunit
MLRKVDPEYLSRKLRMELKETKSEAGTKRITKRLKVVEAFKNSINKPEWMMLEVSSRDSARSSSFVPLGWWPFRDL